MSFQPVVPVSGFAGWKFLTRTMDNQRAAHANSARVQSDLEYFRENIGEVQSAEQLVKDYRLLSVALGAFGLSEDIGNKFFIQKVLEDGALQGDALANKLSDKRYLAMTKAFGFGDFPVPNTQLSTFADDIASRYTDRSFETALGQVDESMRLALNAKRELSELASREVSDATKWFTIMGTPPLRTVMEGALNLPSGFATLPLDRQLGEFKDRANRIFGSSDVSQFADSEKMEDLVKQYLVRSSIADAASQFTSGSTALALLANL